MEATELLTPTRQVTVISRELENFEDKATFFSILSQEYPSNNIGLAKAKKWLTKMYNCFDDEIEQEYNVHDDLGDAIYYLDPSAVTQVEHSLATFYRVLSLDCGGVDSVSYRTVDSLLADLSALEAKWFIRFWLKTTRNGLKDGVVKKIIAKHFNKKLATVKKHCNFNSIQSVVSHYERGEEPPCNLTHGKFIKPMLAKEVPMAKWPTNRIVDYKYDGNRYQIHKSGESVIIFNRKGNVVTPQFADVAQVVSEYDVMEAIFDGEIYPIKEDGTPDEHKKMGTRVHSKDHTEAMNRVPVRWVIFDCLKWGERTIMDLSYSDRLEIFKSNPNQAHRMDKDGDVMAFYHQAINDGFEGIIVKDASMPYEAGKRSTGWAKYKPPQIELDVVILAASYGEGRRSNVFGTFEIGVKSKTGFTNIGSIGTGFSDLDLIRLTGQLRKIVENFSNGRYEFLPRVVLEVKADLVSTDAKGNIGLRFPRMNRIRDDKFVADINTIEDVERLI